MQVTQIQSLINQNLAGEMLSYKQLIVHLNWALDELNATLNTVFPEFTSDMTEYTAFPDRYIRMCLVPGAVHHFYVVDEEGQTGEYNFLQDFETNKFRMLRDYSHQIPDEYLADGDNGTTVSTYEDVDGQRGVDGLTYDYWG